MAASGPEERSVWPGWPVTACGAVLIGWFAGPVKAFLRVSSSQGGGPRMGRGEGYGPQGLGRSGCGRDRVTIGGRTVTGRSRSDNTQGDHGRDRSPTGRGRSLTGPGSEEGGRDTQLFLGGCGVSLDDCAFRPICLDDSDDAGLLRSGWKLVSDVNLEQQTEFVGLAADIVSSYVANNNLQVAELPALIASVHASLTALGRPAEAPVEETRATPAQIRKSVTPDHLMSFIDGKPYRSLKRHLTSQGMTPAEYRQKFGLPHDYPMVAASYAAQRSALAKSLGLGQRRRDAAAAAREEALQEAAQEAPRAEAAADEAPPEKPARRRSRKAAE